MLCVCVYLSLFRDRRKSKSGDVERERGAVAEWTSWLYLCNLNPGGGRAEELI